MKAKAQQSSRDAPRSDFHACLKRSVHRGTPRVQTANSWWRPTLAEREMVTRAAGTCSEGLGDSRGEIVSSSPSAEVVALPGCKHALVRLGLISDQQGQRAR